MSNSTTRTAQDVKAKPRTGDVLIQENLDFAGLLLSDPVQQGLQKAGFVRPSPIQLKAIPLGRCGLDLIVQAKSGTGKTCVFTVIALESLLLKSTATQILVLAPTREIAIQIWEVVNSIGSCMPDLRCYTFIGGTPLSEDKNKLKVCHIAVGTPGRIKQLIDEKVLVTNNIRLFVLDEADKLLEESFQDQINWIYSILPENKQIMALSATYPEELAQHLTAYMRNPTFVRLNSNDPALLGIRQYFKKVPFHPLPNKLFDNKTEALKELLSSVDFHQCLVFSNYQLRAQSLSDELNAQGWPVAYISGSREQEERRAAMASLKQMTCRVLISTDLTSRGIDAENVNLVINLDLPRSHETYLHRIGRAGRFGSYGAAISFVAEGREVEELRRLESICKTSIKKLPVPVPSDIARSSGFVSLDHLVTTETILTQKSDRGQRSTKSQLAQEPLAKKTEDPHRHSSPHSIPSSEAPASESSSTSTKDKTVVPYSTPVDIGAGAATVCSQIDSATEAGAATTKAPTPTESVNEPDVTGAVEGTTTHVGEHIHRGTIDRKVSDKKTANGKVDTSATVQENGKVTQKLSLDTSATVQENGKVTQSSRNTGSIVKQEDTLPNKAGDASLNDSPVRRDIPGDLKRKPKWKTNNIWSSLSQDYDSQWKAQDERSVKGSPSAARKQPNRKKGRDETKTSAVQEAKLNDSTGTRSPATSAVLKPGTDSSPTEPNPSHSADIKKSGTPSALETSPVTTTDTATEQGTDGIRSEAKFPYPSAAAIQGNIECGRTFTEILSSYEAYISQESLPTAANVENDTSRSLTSAQNEYNNYLQNVDTLLTNYTDDQYLTVESGEGDVDRYLSTAAQRTGTGAASASGTDGGSPNRTTVHQPTRTIHQLEITATEHSVSSKSNDEGERKTSKGKAKCESSTSSKTPKSSEEKTEQEINPTPDNSVEVSACSSSTLYGAHERKEANSGQTEEAKVSQEQNQHLRQYVHDEKKSKDKESRNQHQPLDPNSPEMRLLRYGEKRNGSGGSHQRKGHKICPPDNESITPDTRMTDPVRTTKTKTKRVDPYGPWQPVKASKEVPCTRLPHGAPDEVAYKTPETHDEVPHKTYEEEGDSDEDTDELTDTTIDSELAEDLSASEGDSDSHSRESYYKSRTRREKAGPKDSNYPYPGYYWQEEYDRWQEGQLFGMDYTPMWQANQCYLHAASCYHQYVMHQQLADYYKGLWKAQKQHWQFYASWMNQSYYIKNMAKEVTRMNKRKKQEPETAGAFP